MSDLGEGDLLSCWSGLVASAPTRTCVSDVTQELTVRELDAWSDAIARRLRRRNIGAGDAVAVTSNRSAATIASILGVWKAGAAYVPVDVAQRSRAEALLQAADVRVVLGAPDPELAAALGIDVMAPERPPLDEEMLDDVPRSRRPGMAAAYVIFTSGSTGLPKGVVVHDGALLALQKSLAATVYVDLAPGAKVSVNSPFVFDASVKQVIQLFAGHVLEIIPDDIRRDVETLDRYLIDRGVDVFDTTPSQLLAMFELGLMKGSVGPRVVLVGGEAPSQRLWDEMRASSGTGRTFVNLYGPTEGTVDATSCVVRGERPSLGAPLPHVRLYLLDRHMRTIPVGVVGQIFIGGGAVARGYLGDGARTATSFLPDPFGGDGGRMYATGDLARRRTDGTLEFVGRRDRQLKRWGHRIEPAEVEAVITRHPSVGAAVVMRVDAGGRECLAAFLHPMPGSQPPTVEGIRALVSRDLPDYMVPDVVLSGPLPLARSGKIDHARLRETITSAIDRPSEQSRAPSVDGLTEVVLGVWRSVMGADALLRGYDFVKAGGTSLDAAKIVARLRLATAKRIPLRTLFDHPDLRHFVSVIAGLPAADCADAPEEHEQSRDTAPLSPDQERLWTQHQAEPDESAYNLAAAVRLRGRLHVEALECALDDLLQRHRALRTRVDAAGDGWVQIVDPIAKCSLSVHDLRGHDPPGQDARWRQLAAAETARPFDLRATPLIRVSLIKLEEDVHVLVIVFHHIAADGWSANIISHDLAELYRARVIGAPPELPTIAVEYFDHVRQQRAERVDNGEHSSHPTLVASARRVPPLDLSCGLPRSPEILGLAAVDGCDLPATLVERLRCWARAENATLYMALLAGFFVAVTRFTGQRRLAVGSPAATRLDVGAEDTVGLFARLVVLDLQAGDDTPGRELLNIVRSTVLASFGRSQIVSGSSTEARAAFVMQPPRTPPVTVPGLAIGIEEVSPAHAKFDLAMSVREREDTVEVRLEYRTDVMSGATASALLDAYRRGLAALVSDPSAPLASIEVIDEANILRVSRGPRVEPPAGTLVDAFERVAHDHPDRIALTDPDGRVTYQELTREVDALAGALVESGVGPGTLAGLCMEPCLDLVVAILAILKTGAAYVPFDLRHPIERIAYMLDATKPAAVVVDARGRDALSASGVRLVSTRARPVGVVQLGVERRRWPESLAYVLFTSGSTGMPKGVACDDASVLNRFAWMWRAFPFDDDEVVCLSTSIGFADSVWQCLGGLLAGVRTHIMDRDSACEQRELARQVAEYGITRLVVVPSFLDVLVDLDGAALECLRGIRIWTSSGEPLSVALLRTFRRRLPGTRLLNLYGLTEAISDSTCWEAGLDEGAVTIGRPIDNVSCYVLDRRLCLSSVGQLGDLFLGGLGVAVGYHGAPAATAARFLPDPYGAPGGRMCWTGDIARWTPEGDLECHGRSDRQVKVRGIRVELDEVEAVLRLHPEVALAATVATPPALGTSVVAFIVPRPGANTSEKALRTFVASRTTAGISPERFVMVDHLPFTTSGKINRPALIDTLVEGHTGLAIPEVSSETERQIGTIWAEVLSAPSIGLHDDFFSVGGNSLSAMRILVRFSETMGVRMRLGEFVAHGTIAGQAAFVERLRDQGPAERVTTPRASAKALLDLQQLDDATIGALLAATDAGSTDGDP